MTTFEYLGISKTKSLRMNKHSYLLSTSFGGNGIVNIEVLDYGYLQAGYSVGSKRGWFISKRSMAKEDLEKYYTPEVGQIKVKIQ